MVETLAIKHTDYLKRVSDFLKSDFIIEDNEIQIETILISSYASLGYNSNLEADYQNSIHRKIATISKRIHDVMKESRGKANIESLESSLDKETHKLFS